MSESHLQPPTTTIVDLNVDPPDFDSIRVTDDDGNYNKTSTLVRDADVTDTDGKQIKRFGRSRSKNGKIEYLPECSGADLDADQANGPSSREEKVCSLKTGLIHVAKKMPKNAHAHFIIGLMYQRMGQPQKAVLAYEKAAEILFGSEEDVDRPELLSMVQIHHAQCILLGSSEEFGSDKELEPEELEDVLFKLKESTKSDVRHASVWNTLGLVLLKTGRVQSAISVLSSLFAVAPNDLDCIGNLGLSYLQSGNFELSEKCFQELVLKDQNHPAALINYAALLLCRYGTVVAGAGANASEEASADQAAAVNVAKECLLAAIRGDPKAAHIWMNLANAYHLIGDHKSSAKCLEKAGKLEPNCLTARYVIGVHRIRDAERAQNPSEQLSWAGNEMASILREGDSTLVDPPIAWAGIAMVHKAQHEIAAGFDIGNSDLVDVRQRSMYSFKQVIAEDPDDAVQWHQFGLHNLCTQQYKKSETYLKAAVARLSNCSYAWSNLGISLQLSNESSQAEDVYKRALTLAAPQQAHTILSNLGNLYRQLKQYNTAKAMFAKSLELQPGYAPAYNNLGLIFVAESCWEEAKFCFNKAIQTDPLLDAAKSNMLKADILSKMCPGSSA